MTIGSSTGGAGAGKVKFQEFVIKRITDSASPAFFQNLVAGAHYKTVTIEVPKAHGDPRAPASHSCNTSLTPFSRPRSTGRAPVMTDRKSRSPSYTEGFA